ncbi:unnamed protein product [Closterium sp. NIES-64]|nr:unnamed protein product [Closterium sp. NIES-64]
MLPILLPTPHLTPSQRPLPAPYLTPIRCSRLKKENSVLPKSSSDDVMSDLLCNEGDDDGSGGGSAAAVEAPPAEAPRAPGVAGLVQGQRSGSSNNIGGSPLWDSNEGVNTAVSSVLLSIASIATAVSTAAALADSPEAQLLQAAREALNKALCFENE